MKKNFLVIFIDFNRNYHSYITSTFKEIYDIFKSHNNFVNIVYIEDLKRGVQIG